MASEEQKKTSAYFQRGFRPFFSAAMAMGSFTILAWMYIYFSGWQLPVERYSGSEWHAHEMIFGFGMAVVAGFLLTAMQNWTGIATIQGIPLLILLILWLSARFLPFFLSDESLWFLALTDLSFNFLLAVATTAPIVQAKQWKNFAFSGKVIMLLIANALFYAGLLGYWHAGIHYGIYIGFYLILAVIFTMARRIIPFFIEKGVGYPYQPKNWKALDLSNLFLFLAFSITDIFYTHSTANMLFALTLFLLNCIRLYGWYTHGIWKKTLLWSLYLGYAWLVFGFLLRFLSLTLTVSPFLAIHSFAYGGFGLISIAMMARVALGHTGRSVQAPPKILFSIFSLITIGAVVRVLFPLFNMEFYSWWIGIAQVLWIAAFAMIFITYLPFLIAARVDGKDG